MIIEQFENKHLAHFSYAIVSECEHKIVLIDPSTDPQAYYDFAQKHHADIIAVIETHPHADFVSSHMEIALATGASIYASAFAGAQYPHTPFDDTMVLSLGKVRLRALNTPGHSPDSICIVLEREGMDRAVFTGDTLFIGDCGRPDLREKAGKNTASREVLARSLYQSLRQQLKPLADHILVYPAHGAGTLCGKSLEKEKVSTMGEEKSSNWSLHDMTEDDFVEQLLADQPFIPGYFDYDVDLNLAGVSGFNQSVQQVPIIRQPFEMTDGTTVIDTRDEKLFKSSRLPYSINLMTGDPFETWLGTLINPHEPFYLAAGDEDTLHMMIGRTASIGYEKFIEAAFVLEPHILHEAGETMPVLDHNQFRLHPEHFTIVDVRNESEAKDKSIFADSIRLPLATLIEHWKDIPLHKPIVVHCAGGYRSAAASSLLFENLKGKVKTYDLGEAVKDFPGKPRFLTGIEKAAKACLLQNTVDNDETIVYLKSGPQTYPVKLVDILYLEKDGNYMTVHLKDKRILIRENMSGVFGLIPAPDFIRVHKSYVIAIRHVTLIEAYQLTINGAKIPIGITYRESLRARLGMS